MSMSSLTIVLLVLVWTAILAEGRLSSSTHTPPKFNVLARINDVLDKELSVLARGASASDQDSTSHSHQRFARAHEGPVGVGEPCERYIVDLTSKVRGQTHLGNCEEKTYLVEQVMRKKTGMEKAKSGAGKAMSAVANMFSKKKKDEDEDAATMPEDMTTQDKNVSRTTFCDISAYLDALLSRAASAEAGAGAKAGAEAGLATDEAQKPAREGYTSGVCKAQSKVGDPCTEHGACADVPGNGIKLRTSCGAGDKCVKDPDYKEKLANTEGKECWNDDWCGENAAAAKYLPQSPIKHTVFLKCQSALPGTERKAGKCVECVEDNDCEYTWEHVDDNYLPFGYKGWPKEWTDGVTAHTVKQIPTPYGSYKYQRGDFPKAEDRCKSACVANKCVKDTTTGAATTPATGTKTPTEDPTQIHEEAVVDPKDDQKKDE